MVSLIIVYILTIAVIIFLICKTIKSKKLKKWQKHVICTAIVGFVCLAAYCGMIGNDRRMASRLHEPGISLSKSPKLAQKYLNSIDINITLPEFTVRRHSISFTGGDDTVEWWDIDFTQKISESFISSLDSLCHSDPSRWSHDKHVVRRGMSGEDEEFYIFSYWDPVSIERQETVVINITMNKGALIHRKI